MRTMMPSFWMLFNFKDMHTLAAWMMLMPLMGALVSGLGAKRIGKQGAHIVTVATTLIAFLLAVYIGFEKFSQQPSSVLFFDWIDGCAVGVLLDRLSIIMSIVVTLISLFVHIYSVGYMREDPGYQRFFSYVSFFTFAMLSLVLAPNLLQTFFGWEGVGVASYLLIGFWFTKSSAADGSLKAFLINRFADIGLLLALAIIYSIYNHLDIVEIYRSRKLLIQHHVLFGTFELPSLSVVAWCFLLAAMGKSAQVPLHVWLPESMEGPTPISALIHAATMVTAGIYLMCRMSFIMIEVPDVQYTLVIIGATGAFLLACVGCVQYDLKRIVAYSTLSQLGYMMASCGAGLYPLAIFHLVTHACFKALLFLSAGAVIMSTGHQQDIRLMGGLRQQMPVTALCFLVGSLALVAFPGFAGFYSKDAILIAMGDLRGHFSYPFILLILSAGLSSVYIFRAFGMVFLGDIKAKELNKVSLTMILPMLLLAVMSIFIGFICSGMFVQENALGAWVALPSRSLTLLSTMSKNFQAHLWHHVPFSIGFWLSMAGIIIALKSPKRMGDRMGQFAGGLIRRGFGFDEMFVQITHVMRKLADLCGWYDRHVIDQVFVMGMARLVVCLSSIWQSRRQLELNRNIFMMLFGLILLFLAVITVI